MQTFKKYTLLLPGSTNFIIIRISIKEQRQEKEILKKKKQFGSMEKFFGCLFWVDEGKMFLKIYMKFLMN